ncbi:MAG TPA: hypothetical protein VN259_02475 [Xanthomonadales bacterium]|nr:hypothetical protein [Xanthomonadales bacterium]
MHAGFHKTGTTSFQEFCRRNREALRSGGLHYARFDFQRVLDRPNHSYVFRSAYHAAVDGDNTLRASLVRELQRQLDVCDRLLVSGEVICVLREPARMLLLQDLRALADEIRFILLVRHPKSYFQGALQEHLKTWGNAFGLPEDRLATVIDHEWGSLYTKRLALFREHLAEDELIVRRYEDAVRAPNGVIGYLVEDCLGLHLPTALYASSLRINAALAHETVLLNGALKSLRDEANGATIDRLVGKINGAPGNGCRQAFAAALAHRLPPIATELSWLKANFGIEYDLDEVAFDQLDETRLWSREYVDALLAFARKKLARDDQRLLCSALDFIAANRPADARQSGVLTAASQELRRGS